MITVKLIKNLENVIHQGIAKLADVSFIEQYKSAQNTPTFLRWLPYSLSHGLPGLLVLFSHSRGWLSENQRQEVIEHLIWRIYFHVENNTPNLSLFNGLTGIAFSLYLVSKGTNKYETILLKLDNIISNHLDELLRTDSQVELLQLRPAFFDVITGITGIGQYLLMRIVQGGRKELISDLLKIVRKIQEIHQFKQARYSWWISAQNQFSLKEQHQYPHGNYNLGLAHGVLGPFSLFNSSFEAGYLVDGHRETLSSMSRYLNHFIVWDSEEKPYWPPRRTAQAGGQLAAFIDPIWHNRDGWCYGNASCGYLLRKMSINLQDEEIGKISLDLIRGSLSHKLVFDTSSFCHGLAGHLQILLSLFPLVREEEPALINSFLFNIKEVAYLILNSYSDDNLFGFKDTEYYFGIKYILDEPGLLTGTAGILCVLINIWQLLTNHPLHQEWSAVFLLN